MNIPKINLVYIDTIEKNSCMLILGKDNVIYCS